MKKNNIVCYLYIFITSTLSSFDRSPEELLKTLSLREKIAQLFVVAAASCFDQPTEVLASSLKASPYTMEEEYVLSLIKKYGVGGIIFLYKSSPEIQLAVTKEFQSSSKIPLFIMQDAEWGLDMRLGIDPTKIVRYPRNMTLGAIIDTKIVYDVALEIGKQCAFLGVHMNLAPVMDVNNNKANPVIHMRSFGDNAQRVAKLGTLFMRGLQDGGVLSCGKHFPGHGDTAIDSHLALPIIHHDRKRLDAIELLPFKKIIDMGIDGIMLAHMLIPSLDETGTPSSLSKNIVTGLLQEELSFKGLIITDGLGMEAVRKKYEPGNLELAAFLAGNDMLLCPLDVPRAIDLIEQEILSGRVTEKEVDRRVLKILKAKEHILKKQKKIKSSLQKSKNFLLSEKAFKVQRDAYRAAITVIKQDQNFIFSQKLLKKSTLVQIGNLPEEQFKKLCKKDALHIESCSANFLSFELDLCIKAAQKTDTVILLIGDMNSYISKNFGIAPHLFSFIQQVYDMGKKIGVVLFGTPYSIKLFDSADLSIIAYEDITVVQEAVFDLLCGRLQATGKLPVMIEDVLLSIEL